MDRDSHHAQQLNNLFRLGTVTEVDLAAARCRVQSGEMHTDFLPWVSAAAGNVSIWCPPCAGEQVGLLCGDGDPGNGIVLRGIYSDTYRAPSDKAAVTLMQFADGAVIHYDSAQHLLSALLPSGGKATITADGGLTINGPVTINGKATITGATAINADLTVSGKATASADVVGGGISLKGHKHSAVQPGSGASGPPA